MTQLKEILIRFIETFTHLNDEEKQFMMDSYEVKELKKGAVLLEEGKVTTDSFIVLEGCVRKYRIVNGEEKTTDFFTQYQVAADFESLSKGTASKHTLVCLQKSIIAIISTEAEKEFTKRFPRFKEIEQQETEKMMGEAQDKLSDFMTSTPEERYLNLQGTRPELFLIAPQRQIASYLGITPESLSRIRKRLAKKG
ncbi:MAG: Crp/Fnr family transcriptional regulator [Bacteroidia bacterium]